MDKATTIAQIQDLGLIPILRTPRREDAEAIADILFAAGLGNVEIPLTVPSALDLIADLGRRYAGRMLVGAGTVLDPEMAGRCVQAGAQFIISPAVNVETIARCRHLNVAIFPGALTPTEIVLAHNAGADMIKVFPCSAMGGASYIRALKAPLPQIPLIPTGGVSVSTAAEFIEAGAAALGVGSDLVDLSALRAGHHQVIADRAQAYLSAVKQARARL